MNICPLQDSGAIASGERDDTNFPHQIDCWEDKCAWWDAEDGKCAMLVMAQHIRRAHYELNDLGETIRNQHAR